MKTLLNKLLKGRITRWGFLAMVLIAVGAVVGGMSPRHYKLAGTWPGEMLGIKSTAIITPLDLDGRTASLQIQFATWPAEIQALLEASGAQTLTTGLGEMVMRDRNSANFCWVAYAVTDARPAEIKAIWVARGSWTFTGVDTAINCENVCIYAPYVALCPNGLPDPKEKECVPLTKLRFPASQNVRMCSF